MLDATRKTLNAALYRLLRPLARVMLRHGMAYGSFAELARKAFVDESLAQLAREGNRETISAVAARTGLTRKEARRLVDFDIESFSESDQRHNRVVRVLTAWSFDPRFLNSDGTPRVLPPEGENSFASLVREYSGDVPPIAMLTTLQNSNTVEAGEAGIAMVNRAYLPTQTPAASLQILGNDVFELLSSIDHNLSHRDERRVFQRKVSNHHVQRQALRAFRDLSNRKSQELLEDYDAWLAEHETGASDREDGCYVSVGIYYFDSTLDEDESE
jgi:hypothetical protein